MPQATDSPRPHRRDKPCWRCAYPLRRLPHDSQKCPECGLPVRISLSEDSGLDFADPAWLGRLGVASFLMCGATALPIPILLLPILVDYTEPLILPFAAAAIVGITGLLIVSWWIIGAPPAYGLWESRSTAKTIGRVVYSAVLALATFFIALAIWHLSIPEPAIVLLIVWLWLVQIAQVFIHYRLDAILQRQSGRWLRRFNRGAGVLSLLSFFAPCLIGTPIVTIADRADASVAMWIALGTFTAVCALYAAFWARLGVAFAYFHRDAADLWNGD